MTPEKDGGARRAGRRAVDVLRRLDGQPLLLALAQSGRRRLPGDDRYGDPLSVEGAEVSQAVGRQLAAMTAERPSALREAGLSALQVWQAVSEAQGRGHGNKQLAILFTDLVEFSSWALEAGDERAVDLLREISRAVEPLIERGGGRVVKRLGDGLMAVFPDARQAVEAAHAAAEATEAIEIAGYSPRMRAGVHLGTPRRVGRDYIGVDVNIAARVAAAAGPGEVLVSESVREALGDEDMSLKRRWRFRAKGAPKDLRVYAADASARPT